MQVKQSHWTIKKLYATRTSIDLNPAWQRGATWRSARQVLLIDSILRGMDIPKIYLRKLAPSNAFDFDAVDGQQRIRAILQFRDGLFALNHPEGLPNIEGLVIEGKKYADLNIKLRERFEKFRLSIGEIQASRSDEIRNLFARLQMGMSLNPAELRNAMSGPLGHSIVTTASTHSFFRMCKISSDRYKHRDYAAHAFAIAATHGSRDVKAIDLKNMIFEYGPERSEDILDIAELVGEALSVLEEVNEQLNYSITQKWIFVDLVWLIIQTHAKNQIINSSTLATRFKRFEALRLENMRRPELLIQDAAGSGLPKPLRVHLYEYIQAFRSQGGLKLNLNIRNKAITAFCG